jgi:small subunit ribosomal protein S1
MVGGERRDQIGHVVETTMGQSEPGTTPHEEDFASVWQTLADAYANPVRGDVRKGVIVSVRPGEVIVDIGAKQDAIVSTREMQALRPEELLALKVGSTIHVCIVRADDRDDHLVVSIRLAREYEDWQRAQELLESGEIVTCKVTDHNKGGLICTLGTLQGFVPTSQIANLDQRLQGAPQPDGLAQLVGQELALKVIEVNRRRRRLILSERAAFREWRAHQRDRLLAEIKEGEVRTGTVSSLREFGAFVDLGGMDGLVHLSELSWSRIKHPSEVLRPGDQVEVLVLQVDRELQRVGLSLKRMQPDPWTQAGDRYQPGQLVKGVVTHLAKFGAFVELEPGIEGLIHISELAERNVSDPAEVVSEGDRLTLLVLDVEPDRQRIGLSLRQVPEPPSPVAPEGEPPLAPPEAPPGGADAGEPQL